MRYFYYTLHTSGLSGTSVTYSQVKSAASKSTMEVITTGSDGSASTSTESLPYGTYYVIETKAATGYDLNTTWVGMVTVREDGTMYEAKTIADTSDSGTYTTAQQIYLAGISLTKADLEDEDDVPQGHSIFSGATFTIINASDALAMNKDGKEIPTAKSKISSSPTYAELRALADDGSYTMQTITTDANGFASTGSTDLPYGTYYVIETESSYGYWILHNFHLLCL